MPAPTPPRPELVALLDAVKDHPDDDTPRLVLADWLDEQDDPLDAERARFIRADIARAREVPARDQTADEVAAAAALLRRWLGPVVDFITTGRFERGLPTVYADVPRLLKPDAPAVLATESFAFVQFVHLLNAGGPRMGKLAALPAFRFVPGIGLRPFTALGAGPAARFFASPNLAGLRQVAFRSVKPGAVGTQALAANPALARLRKLDLAHNQLVDGAVAALAAGAHLAGLEVLDLSDNNIGDKGAAALAVSKAFPNLRELNLRENPRLTDVGKQALIAAFGPRVKLG